MLRIPLPVTELTLDTPRLERFGCTHVVRAAENRVSGSLCRRDTLRKPATVAVIGARGLYFAFLPGKTTRTKNIEAGDGASYTPSDIRVFVFACYFVLVKTVAKIHRIASDAAPYPGGGVMAGQNRETCSDLPHPIDAPGREILPVRRPTNGAWRDQFGGASAIEK